MQDRWSARYEKENGRSYASVYREKNPSYFAAKAREYYAKKHVGTPPWAADELDELIIVEAFDLARTRTEVTGVRWEVDHQVPLRSKLVCGLHCGSNLAVIPQSTNRRKRNSYWPDMWA